MARSFHIGIGNIVSLILVYGDRYIIAFLLGTLSAGQYALAYDTIGMVWIAVSAMMSASLPSLAKEIYNEPNPSAHTSASSIKITKNMITLFIVLPCLFSVFIAPYIYDWWIGSQQSSIVGQIASIMAIGIAASAMSQLNLALLQIAGGAKVGGQLQILNLGLAVALLGLFLPTFGVIGAAFAFSARLCIDALLIRRALDRYLGVNYGFQLLELSIWMVALIIMRFTSEYNS